MLVVNPARLRQFRGKPRCELCGRATPCINGLDPHHFRKRGLGGGYRLDVSINLIAVCRTCHDQCESQAIPEWQVLNAIACREQTKPAPLLAVLDWLLSLDKYLTPACLKRALRRLKGEARRLAIRVLKEIRDGSETGSLDQGRKQNQAVHGAPLDAGQPGGRRGLGVSSGGWVQVPPAHDRR